MYKFGSTSMRRLLTCHPDLQRVMKEAIVRTPIDFSIVCGERTEEEQMEAFNNGFSRAKFGQSPHNYSPSLAVDVCPYVGGVGLVWDNNDYWEVLTDVIFEAAALHKVNLTWGGNFRSITDKPHWELTNWKTMI